MQIQGAGYVSSASSVYSAAAAQPGSTVAGTGPAAQDSASISAFSGDGGSGTAQDLNSLYEQKAQAEGELGDLKGQAADAQAQINARRGEINKEQQGSQDSSEAQDEYDKAHRSYGGGGGGSRTTGGVTFSWPTYCTTITSYFGYRTHPVCSVPQSL